MEIKQTPEHITLNQDQYVKNIVSIFEISFKHQSKIKDSTLPVTLYLAKRIDPQQSFRQNK